LNVNNGARFSTYAIEGNPGAGDICLNGAAARLAAKNDIVIILTYQEVAGDQAQDVKPRMVYVDEKNHIKSTKNVDTWMDHLLTA
jgi:aspartate 1-decarboxylase